MAILKYKKEDGEWGVVETPSAVKYTKQVLTEAQKSQAQKNIGVDETVGEISSVLSTLVDPAEV